MEEIAGVVDEEFCSSVPEEKRLEIGYNGRHAHYILACLA